MNRLTGSTSILCLLVLAIALISGCAEQPYGYIFVPEQRDQINVARQTGDFISALYDQADPASDLLEKAGLTDDYATILPEGWIDVTLRDGNGQPILPYYRFYKSYLDKKFTELQIDRAVLPGAIRNPSSLRYNYFEVASLQNPITRELYPTTDRVERSDIRYSDNLQNLKYIDGWYSITRTVPFEQEIEVQGQGQSFNYTYYIYLKVGWSLRVEHFSIDPQDQTGRVIIEGQFPIRDEEGVLQHCHVSGRFEIDAKGKGGGDIWLYGQPAARLNFTGRSFGFRGNFTLFSDNHKNKYIL